MRVRRPLIILGLVAAIAALAIAGTALAQTPTPTQQAKTNYREFFLDRLASALNVTRDKLNAAFTQARNETVDQAVKDGKLTQEQADKIKSRQGMAPFGFGFRGFGRGPMGKGHERGGLFMMGNSDVRSAIAQALGMTPDELTSQLRSGKSLADLAKGKEQAVKDAIVNAIKPRLDQAVKNGKLTQDRENQILDQIRSADLSKFGGHWARGWNKGNGTQKQAPGNKPSLGPVAPSISAS